MMKKLLMTLFLINIPLLMFCQEDIFPSQLISGDFAFYGSGTGVRLKEESGVNPNQQSETTRFNLGFDAKYLRRKSTKWWMGPGFEYDFSNTIYERNNSNNYLSSSKANSFGLSYHFRYLLYTKNDLGIYLSPSPFYSIIFISTEYALSDGYKRQRHEFGASLECGLFYRIHEKFQLLLNYDLFSFYRSIDTGKESTTVTHSTVVQTQLTFSSFRVGGELLF